MTLNVSCPCGKRYAVDASKAGKRLRCRGCGTVLDIPLPSSQAIPLREESYSATEGYSPVAAGEETTGSMGKTPPSAPAFKHVRANKPKEDKTRRYGDGAINYVAALLAPDTPLENIQKTFLVLGFALFWLWPQFGIAVSVYLIASKINTQGIILLAISLFWTGLLGVFSVMLLR